MVFTIDEKQKRKLRHLTVFEYKMTCAYAVLSILAIVLGLPVSYITYCRYYSDGFYADEWLSSFDSWFTLTNLSFFIFAMSFAAAVYMLYELRRWYLCDNTNLNANDAHMLLVNNTLVYISGQSRVPHDKKQIIYMPVKNITHVIYDKRFKRLELYGMFYKDNIDKGNYINEPMLLGSVLLYDFYTPNLVKMLMERGVEIKPREGILADKWDYRELVIEYDERNAVRDEIEKCFCNSGKISLSEYIDDLFEAEQGMIVCIHGDSNLIDRKNYRKYYMVAFILLLIAALSIFLEHMYGEAWGILMRIKYYERIIIVIITCRLSLWGFNGYDIDITKKGPFITLVETSHIYLKEMKHVFEFRAEDIKYVEYSFLRGCTIRVTGTYTCYYDFNVTEKLELKNYGISFKCRRSMMKEFKRAVDLKKDYMGRVRDKGIKRVLSCYNWK